MRAFIPFWALVLLCIATACRPGTATLAPGARAPLPGFADTHLHQMAELAFGAGFLHGKHRGPPALALAPCSGGPGDHGFVGGEGFFGHHPKRRNGHPTYDGWPRWDAITHQQVHELWLRQAHRDGLRLIVMAAVDFRPMCKLLPAHRRSLPCDGMLSIDRQIEAAHAFARAHADWYEIARSSADARRIIEAGKQAVVLAIEYSDLFETGDFVSALDRYHRMGVRALQPVHELDNRFAGAAHQATIFKLFQKLRTPDRGTLLSGFELGPDGYNVRGLSEDGKRLVREMMKRHMLVDLAHASYRAIRDAYAIAVENAYYPLFISHAHVKAVAGPKRRKHEWAVPDDIAALVRRTGGTFGLRTSPEDYETWPQAGVESSCAGSTRSFAQAYAYADRVWGIPITLGSDLNGFAANLVPRFGPNACAKSGPLEREAQRRAQGDRAVGGVGSDYDVKGLAHVGLLGDVLRDLRKLGVPTRTLETSADAFVRMWERAEGAR
jgi:microsomal dipeptidase-like Zn-dependent dipeptidase